MRCKLSVKYFTYTVSFVDIAVFTPAVVSTELTLLAKSPPRAEHGIEDFEPQRAVDSQPVDALYGRVIGE